MPGYLTPSTARDLIERHGLRAARRHGQHFLVDPNVVRKIVRLADIAPDETVLEIGPGLGSLTVALAEAAQRVVVTEIDDEVVPALRETIGDDPRVEIHVGDALRMDLGPLLGGPARLVANLPYNVATPLLLRILADVPEVTGGLVMGQRELAERWTARPGTKAYGAVSVAVAFHARAGVAADVPPTVFWPRPKVESVLVSFHRHAQPPVAVSDPAGFLAFVRACFAHRRKTLRNELRAAGYEGFEDALPSPRARAQELDLAGFAALYGAVA